MSPSIVAAADKPPQRPCGRVNTRTKRALGEGQAPTGAGHPVYQQETVQWRQQWDTLDPHIHEK